MKSNLLQEHLDAENAHALDRIMATYVAHPVIELNGQRIEGLDKVRDFHRSFGFSGEAAASFSQVRVTERHRHQAADGITIIEQTLTGVHSGLWQKLPATGHSFSLAVCTVYSFDATGKLESEHVYYDTAWAMRQLTR